MLAYAGSGFEMSRQFITDSTKKRESQRGKLSHRRTLSSGPPSVKGSLNNNFVEVRCNVDI